MPQPPVWKTIAQQMTDEIASGHYAPGDKLPTEASLSARFGVNRHTVRRALASLNEAGLSYSRRGAGVFVAMAPTDYAIGRRVRFHQNLAAAGKLPGATTLRLETRAADTREAEALNLVPGSKVVVYERLSSADNAPIALSRSVFPAERFPGLLDKLERSGSVTAALRDEGLDDYLRASTRLTAKSATTVQALHLRIAQGAPILRTVSLNTDKAGQPIEYGHTWFAGDRVTLTVSHEE